VAILDGTKKINLPQPALSHLKEHQYSVPLQSLVKALNGKITIDKSTGKVFVEMQVVGKLDPNSAEPNLLTSDKFYEGEGEE
jgi:hypothetical protein